ncbi:MAG: TAXI family TRAP transporter solute-binding subunit [Rhodospirillales bacterium]|nr:TAXI family TRAP transporter solute-binding subunit [Rhodospirillales bacterium]
MRIMKILAMGTVLAFAATSVSAQTVGIGTTKGGATAQVTAGISKIVSSHAGGMQMRTQVMGGTQKYIPVVNAGKLEFGVSNMMQYYMAKKGIGLSKGHKHDNLQLLATMMTFRIGWLVPKNSKIKSVADFKGLRVPHGFKAAPLFHFLLTAGLANGGLSYNDVQKIPSVGLRQHWNMFKQGKIDVAWGGIGAGHVKDMNAKIKGGVRFLSLNDSPAAIKRTLKHAPKTFLLKVNPAKPYVGVKSPVNIIAFNYMLWAHKGVSGKQVYKVVKAMYDNEKELKGMGPLWRTHFSKSMSKDQGEPYHAGAIKFYKEAGAWKR